MPIKSASLAPLLLLSFLPLPALATDSDGPAALRQLVADHILDKAPATRPAEGIAAAGVTSLFYDGLPYKGKPTRVFAYLGLPAHRAAESNSRKLPAIVLVHGGGGTAFDEWVRLWTSRGYAAIAMDICGCVPKGTYGHWQRHADGGPAGWDASFSQINDSLVDQWPYHAIADVMLAHALLRSLPDVDPDRIGVTGISWGGYLTCLASGVDDCFKFVVPVYGCGYLGDNSVWLPQFEQMGKEKAARWLRNWDPSQYLPAARMPMLWVTGTNDFAYPMDSLRKSYRSTQRPTHLCIRIRMQHGHGGPGEKPEEIHAFADSFCLGGKPLLEVGKPVRDGQKVAVAFTSAVAPVKAELICTKDVGRWQDRKWESLPAALEKNGTARNTQTPARSGRIAATLPPGTTVYFINVTDERGLVTSSDHVDETKETQK